MPYNLCKVCEKKFYIKPSQLKLGYGKYCSRKCQRIGQRKGKLVNCYICNEKIWRTPKSLKHSKSKKYFCSKSCQTFWRNKYYVGPKHPNWHGGNYIHYRNALINKNVPKICNVCKNNDKRVLVAHHIDRNRKNNSTNNLIWLCFNCHFLVHNHNVKLE